MKTSHVRHRTNRGERSKIFPEICRQEVAKSLGVTRSHVSKILSGNVSPSVEVLERMARLLGMTMEALTHRIRSVNHLNFEVSGENSDDN